MQYYQQKQNATNKIMKALDKVRDYDEWLDTELFKIEIERSTQIGARTTQRIISEELRMRPYLIQEEHLIKRKDTKYDHTKKGGELTKEEKEMLGDEA